MINPVQRLLPYISHADVHISLFHISVGVLDVIFSDFCLSCYYSVSLNDFSSLCSEFATVNATVVYCYRCFCQLSVFCIFGSCFRISFCFCTKLFMYARTNYDACE